jgi:hypothetical protein
LKLEPASSTDTRILPAPECVDGDDRQLRAVVVSAASATVGVYRNRLQSEVLYDGPPRPSIANQCRRPRRAIVLFPQLLTGCSIDLTENLFTGPADGDRRRRSVIARVGRGGADQIAPTRRRREPIPAISCPPQQSGIPENSARIAAERLTRPSTLVTVNTRVLLY